MNYQRIKKNADFQKLFKKGKKVYSPELSLLFLPADELSMGVAVSKKHGKAVKRNRIKRLLRAVFDENCLMLTSPCAVILIPKIDGEYTHSAFEKSLKICLKKVNLCLQN